MVIGGFVARHTEQAALNDAATTAVQAADSLLTPYLVKGDFVHPLWPARVTTLDSLITPHVLENGIEHVRLWNPDGNVVYSSTHEEIGQEIPQPAQLARALSGRPVAAIRPAPAANENGAAKVLTMYAPIRLPGSTTPNGAYEVSLDAGPLLAAVRGARIKAWGLVMIGITVLYASMIGLVFRNSRAMVRKTRELNAAFEGTIRSLAAAIDAKDAYTGGHSSEVSRHAEAIARALHLSGEEVDAMRIAGYLHDLGKIGIPDHILRKAGPLDSNERAKIRGHSLIGYRIVKPIPVPEQVKLAVLHNHERWDGGGYPDGLRGDEIPILARILMVADAYEAMTSSRPYRRALDRDEAIAQLRAESSKQFDPNIVDAFIRVLDSARKPIRIRSRSRVRAASDPTILP
ncbi:MAG: HD-GYP domain-containing protein [bacterium]